MLNLVDMQGFEQMFTFLNVFLSVCVCVTPKISFFWPLLAEQVPLGK